MTSAAASKETNFALVGIRLGASNIVVAYFKVKSFVFEFSSFPIGKFSI
jgi:hypothetical protein